MKKAIAKPPKCPDAAAGKAILRAERKQAKQEAALKAVADLADVRAALEMPEHERRAEAASKRDEYFASAVPPNDPAVPVAILFDKCGDATVSLAGRSVELKSTIQGGEPHIAFADVKLAITGLFDTSQSKFDEALIVTGITTKRKATNLRLKVGIDADTRNNHRVRQVMTLSVKLARRCDICGATAVEPLRREFYHTGVFVAVCPVTTDACPASARFTILDETATVVKDGHTHAVRFIDQAPAPVTFSLFPSSSLFPSADTLIECD